MELIIRSTHPEIQNSGNSLKEEDMEADFFNEIRLLKTDGLIVTPVRAVESLLIQLDILELKK